MAGTPAHGVKSGLVDEVRQIGSAHPRGAPGDDGEVDVGADPLVLAVDPEDREALFEIGKGNDDLAVEAPGTEQGGVEDVRTVRGGHDHDALGRIESVHLREHLVEGLLTFVVPAAEAGTALAADRVDLVDEDDRRSLLAGGLEEVTNPAGADSDEHLHEVRTAHRHEGHSGFACDCAGEKGLAGSGRPDEENALRDTGPHLLETSRRLEKVDDLTYLELDPAVSGDVGEGGPRTFGGVEPRPRAADRHDPRHAGLGASKEEPCEPDDHNDRKYVEQDVEKVRRRRVLEGDRHALGLQLAYFGVEGRMRSVGRVALAALRASR